MFVSFRVWLGTLPRDSLVQSQPALIYVAWKFLFFNWFFFLSFFHSMENCRAKVDVTRDSPINSNASWKYCLMFWCGVSLAGICLYRTPGLFWVVDGWQVTLRTQLAPTLDGSMASRPLPSSRWGKTGDAGCVSISGRELCERLKYLQSFIDPIMKRRLSSEIDRLHNGRL